MFEDSLLESGGRDSKLHRRGPWATVISFLIQAAMIGVLVLIPLLYTQTLPKAAVDGLSGCSAASATPAAAARRGAGAQSGLKPCDARSTTGSSRPRPKIPEKIAMIKEDTPPPAAAGVEGGVVGGVPGGQMGGVVGGVLGSIVTQAPVAMPKEAAPPPPPRRSGSRFPPVSPPDCC